MRITGIGRKPWTRAMYSYAWRDGISFGETFTTKKEAFKWAKDHEAVTGYRLGLDFFVIREQRVHFAK